ncbi:MAG TPA: CHAT domain-containing protein [Kofleriaceae bacterium]|nr:CHAT domain-containing protein [Kofleriaceae bacterium]
MTESRFSWIEAACRHNLSILPAPTRAFLDEWASDALSSPIERFALAMRCAIKALAPSSMGERVAWLKRHCLRPAAGDTEIEIELLLPLADWFLTCRLDRWPHWALTEAYLDALRIAILLFPHSNSDRDRNEWLARVWGLDEQEARMFRESATALTLSNPPGFEDERITNFIEGLLETLGVQLDIPPYVEDVPPHIRWIAKVQSLDKRPGVSAEVVVLGRKVQEWLTKATLLEIHSARALNRGRILQPEDVASRWKTVHLEEGGFRKPTIWTSSGASPPRWVVNRIVEFGGRTMHQLVGPMPYWFASFDQPTPMRDGIGMIDPELRDRELHFEFAYDDDPESPVHISWIYDLEDASDLVHLSYVVAIGTIRVDLFHMTPTVQHLMSIDLTLPQDLLERIRALVCSELAGAWANDLERLNVAFVQSHGSDATVGFMTAEWAKAEDVVEDIGLDASAKTSGSWGLYNAARANWLAAESALTKKELVNALLGRAPPDPDELTVKRRVYLRARERLRHDHREAFGALHGESRLAQLRHCLGRHEAFVHFHSGGGNLFAFVVQGGTDEVVEHYFHELHLVAVAHLLHQPPGTPGYVDRLRLALSLCASSLGDLLAALSTAGVRNVFVSLPGIIDELPVHILTPTGHDRPAVEVFDGFTYCASAMLLAHRVRRRSLVFTNRVSLIAHGGLDGLLALDEEVEGVAAAWRRAEVWRDEAATPARALECLHRGEVVHLACHGYASERALGSGLELYDAVRSQGFLTAADLLAAPPLETAASIVVLSSCFGGAHNIARNVVHRFTAIDNVLLRLGVRCVVSSTRSLDGVAAATFGRAFHGSLSAGDTAAVAYRHGMRAIAEQNGGEIAGSGPSALETLSSIRLVGDGNVRGPSGF